MRPVNKIIIHCSATPAGHNVSVRDIDRWHRRRGFACIGYHYVIYLDGTVVEGRPIEKPGAHCRGHNADSIGVCYIGGLDADFRPKDTRTPQQKESLCRLIADLTARFPGATVHGHNEYAAKACPSFNVHEDSSLCAG